MLSAVIFGMFGVQLLTKLGYVRPLIKAGSLGSIVLGGLIQTDDTETINKLPVLGSIPVLGRVFQNKSHRRIKSQLMIYITPHLTYMNPSVIYNPGMLE